MKRRPRGDFVSVIRQDNLDCKTRPLIPVNVSDKTCVICVVYVTCSCKLHRQPEVLLQSWKKEFLKTVKESKAKFLALHCQEVGGKNYEDSMKHVDHFVRYE